MEVDDTPEEFNGSPKRKASKMNDNHIKTGQNFSFLYPTSDPRFYVYGFLKQEWASEIVYNKWILIFGFCYFNVNQCLRYGSSFVRSYK